MKAKEGQSAQEPLTQDEFAEELGIGAQGLGMSALIIGTIVLVVLTCVVAAQDATNKVRGLVRAIV